ncbi:hypothetical protein [Streptomyces cinnamoneus]|uniref:hypothetical protein n=1 Tax=Streptomyces cinnamoneus TaxID=53446 RepID=UPI00379930FF
MTAITLLTDHPAWTYDTDGTASRLVCSGTGSVWYTRWTGATLTLQPVIDRSPVPAPRLTPSGDLPPCAPTELVKGLAPPDAVLRLPNPSLWDAITSALLRRIIRAEQARALYHRWCLTYGPRHDTPSGPVSAVPCPRTVLDLHEQAYDAIGARLHRKALTAAAAAYLHRSEEWSQLDPEDLVKALQEVSGIGPWTAAAAAADFTGDYSVYPHSDLAVRTWARQAAPGFTWPEDERAFAALWHRWAPDRPQLHALTTFTLAWGIHARTEHDKDSTP